MSHGRRTLAIPVLAAIALIGGRPAAAADPASPLPDASEARIASLEARVTELEAFLANALGFGKDTASPAMIGEELILPVVVTRKTFQEKDPAHARWEDYVNLEVEYDTTALQRPASALKGTLVFSDALGEVRYEMPTLVSDMIDPGDPVRQKGLRFKYNQFRDEHQWMHETDPRKMQVHLRIATVMYRDGSTVEYR